jgi:hypothetical protein
VGNNRTSCQSIISIDILLNELKKKKKNMFKELFHFFIVFLALFSLFLKIFSYYFSSTSHFFSKFSPQKLKNRIFKKNTILIKNKK